MIPLHKMTSSALRKLAFLSIAVLLGVASSLSQVPTAASAGTAAAGAADAVQSSPLGDAGMPAQDSGNNPQQASPSNSGPTDANGRASQNSSRTKSDDANRKNAAINTPEPATDFQRMVASTTGRNVPLFGVSLFEGVPSTFAPLDDVPVSASYTLGPGDEVNIQVSGQVNQKLDLRVDRTGAIQVPGLGSVQVAGLPYGQLSQFLNTQFSRIYRGFTINAQLGQLRSIQVFVVGQARRPGSYSISSLSTLLNAIFVSGGPASNGSVRDIQVKRNGRVIDHFDLYDLLLHGDKTHDITLVSGDVIFFPFVGPQVAVVGSVDQSAVYEMKGPTTVNQAIELAGGFTSAAAPGAIRLDRVHEHMDRSIEDLPLATGGSKLLESGDIISVAAIIDRFQNAVTLRGNVANPGRYVWHPGMHLSDLFPSREALITRNYWRKRNALGQSQQDYLASQEGSLQIRANNADRLSADPNAHATGGSSQGGGNSVASAITSGSSTFNANTDVILSAPDIDWDYAVIERLSLTDLTTSLIPFNLGKLVLQQDPSQNLELQAGDVVTIFSKADIVVPSMQQTRFIRLEGEFVASGVYSVLPGETLRQLIVRAGGFTPDAYLYGSEFTRESTRRVEEQRRNEIADALQAQISSVSSSNQARAVTTSDQQAAAASEADAQAALARLRAAPMLGRITLNFHPNSQGTSEIPDIALEDGDRFVVSRVPADISVQGEVYSATAFLYEHGARVDGYLKRAGGPNRDADKKRIYVVRASGDLVSRQYADVFHAPIYPGDTIVVPPVLDRRAVFQRVIDVAQVVSNLGIGIAAVALLTR